MVAAMAVVEKAEASDRVRVEAATAAAVTAAVTAVPRMVRGAVRLWAVLSGWGRTPGRRMPIVVAYLAVGVAERPVRRIPIGPMRLCKMSSRRGYRTGCVWWGRR